MSFPFLHIFSIEHALRFGTRYANKAAYDYHAELPEFQAMHKSFKEEELMERPITIKSVKPVTGFYR